MSEDSNISIRLSKAAKEFNVGMSTIIEFLTKKGFNIDSSPNTKLNNEMYSLLVKEYQSEKEVKEYADQLKDLTYKGRSITVEDKIDNKPDNDFDEDEILIHFSDKTSETKQEKPYYQVPEKKEDQEKQNNISSDSEKEIEIDKIDKKEIDKEDTTKETTKEVELKDIDKKDIDKKDTETVSDIKAEIDSDIKKEDAITKKGIDSDTKPNEDIQLKVLGKITLPDKKKPKNKKEDNSKPNGKNVKKQVEKQTNKQQVNKSNSNKEQQVKKEPNAPQPQAEVEDKPVNFIPTKVKKLEGPKILDKIELPTERKPKSKQPVASSGDDKIFSKEKKKKRKRISNKYTEASTADFKNNKDNKQSGQKSNTNTFKQGGGKSNAERKSNEDRNKHNDVKHKGDKFNKKTRIPVVEEKIELSDEEIQKQIKETLARLSPMGKSKASKHRREKRQNIANELEEEKLHEQEEKKILKVTEFVTANELATMMDIPVTKVISTCMSLGVLVSINQRLDAEILTLVAEEFGFKVEFISIDVQEALAENEEEDRPEDLVPRAPVVTVMGHVDHGKTKLLDFIRHSNVVAGEAGGITQHIGAYEVRTESGKKITFLDTPGHEAFTAMRARGARITDVSIIVIAADDKVMPQTVEAINHAQAANVPIVFAINKIDKPTANVEKIYQELSQMNILVEEWGGKYQSQEISAKLGINIDKLLEKVLLEAELLDLKANPYKAAKGTVIESALDKGRGYVAKILVQDGTLKTGDIILAGTTYGKVKAMFNERNNSVKEAGPSTPVLMLGLNGAPQAGDNFTVMEDEKEAKAIVTRRQQLQREQGLRTQKHITLDEIGRRIAIGDFKELNIIVKADVDGSVEALSDSLLKLSTEEVQVNVIHKSVGAISESDIMLASASNAVIVGFNVRPTLQARKLAEREQIDIRLYSIIYTAIEEIKSAIEGMLAPEIEEVVTCNIEIREVFNISKVGRIAGCMVLDGKVNRQTKIRIIRDGIVIHTGTLGSLKRYKDDVKEVSAGYECGLNIEGYNDIKPGDIIEGYTEKEVSRKL